MGLQHEHGSLQPVHGDDSRGYSRFVWRISWPKSDSGKLQWFGNRNPESGAGDESAGRLQWLAVPALGYLDREHLNSTSVKEI
jgi:hypothetical protein